VETEKPCKHEFDFTNCKESPQARASLA